ESSPDPSPSESIRHSVNPSLSESIRHSRPDRESASEKASPDDLACIIYTSGTTGHAKGVMLSHGNLTSCVQSCYSTQYRDQKDRWLSICPMAHTLELTVGTLYPLLVGASVHYLSKPAVPSILLKAMQEVRPTTVLIVPLIIEKIYRNSVLPTIRNSRILSWMSEHMDWLLCRIVGMKLKKTFGGKVDFLGIGGAKLDIEVERFLLKAGFPYAVGYGLTETSPLLSYSVGRLRVPGTIGLPVENVKMKLINVNPQTGEGEIVAKGPNVMLGYYKEPEKTAEVFTSDGWFRTGDLASVDGKGRFYIKGRRTNMILGPSGENIYPEDIEQVINSVAPVNESLVVSRGGRLVALVNFNEDALDWDREGEEEFFRKIEEYKAAIMDFVNRNVKKTSRVNDIQVVREPFEKTATRKIRRFKYTCQG
ncbi:MAG: AMP-binding protein, partial [Candidatus Cryptobacteroides sp.]